MNPVGAVHVGSPGRTEHHGVALRPTGKTVGGRVGVVIGLDLDNRAPDTIDQQRRSDQVRRDLMHAAVKKCSMKSSAVRCFGAPTTHVASLQHIYNICRQ